MFLMCKPMLLFSFFFFLVFLVCLKYYCSCFLKQSTSIIILFPLVPWNCCYLVAHAPRQGIKADSGRSGRQSELLATVPSSGSKSPLLYGAQRLRFYFCLLLGCRLSSVLPCTIHLLCSHPAQTQRCSTTRCAWGRPPAVWGREAEWLEERMGWDLAREKHLPAEGSTALGLTAQRLSSRVTPPVSKIANCFKILLF